MEYVVVVNESGEAVGTISRDEAHRTGVLHAIAVTYVENDRRDVLVQIRAKDRMHDHSSAGHMEPGESFERTAERELEQELGISGVTLRKIGRGRSEEGSREDDKFVVHLFDIFVCEGEPTNLQKSEVSDTYWASPRTILDDMATGRRGVRYAGGFLASLPIYLEWRYGTGSE